VDYGKAFCAIQAVSCSYSPVFAPCCSWSQRAAVDGRGWPLRLRDQAHLLHPQQFSQHQHRLLLLPLSLILCQSFRKIPSYQMLISAGAIINAPAITTRQSILHQHNQHKQQYPLPPRIPASRIHLIRCKISLDCLTTSKGNEEHTEQAPFWEASSVFLHLPGGSELQ
jgi:hypothetical protein